MKTPKSPSVCQSCLKPSVYPTAGLCQYKAFAMINWDKYLLRDETSSEWHLGAKPGLTDVGSPVLAKGVLQAAVCLLGAEGWDFKLHPFGLAMRHVSSTPESAVLEGFEPNEAVTLEDTCPQEVVTVTEEM